MNGVEGAEPLHHSLSSLALIPRSRRKSPIEKMTKAKRKQHIQSIPAVKKVRMPRERGAESRNSAGPRSEMHISIAPIITDVFFTRVDDFSRLSFLWGVRAVMVRPISHYQPLFPYPS